jgi:hypothetical protein
MCDVAQKVGLLMEEVLSWFKDEKSRRAKLLADNPHRSQKSTCEAPPSPKSVRGSSKVSSASSSYNATSPRELSRIQDTSVPCLASPAQNLPDPPKAKRGRPAKIPVKIEPDLVSPDAKRKKVPAKYPCPDCQNFVPVERLAEHINRKHFPKHVWECPKINRQTGNACSSSPHYRPAYRDDNFATHLKGEHNCPDAEVADLKKTCKFQVTNFFHKICGFCDKSLQSRDESIEHIKDHFRKASEGPNPLLDLGVSLWKEKCGAEHKLQVGIHYRRSQASKRDFAVEDGDCTVRLWDPTTGAPPQQTLEGHTSSVTSVAFSPDGSDEHENVGFGGRITDNSGHDASQVQSSNSHDHDVKGVTTCSDGNSGNPSHDNQGFQQNDHCRTYNHENDELSMPQFCTWTPELPSSDYSTTSGPSAVHPSSLGPLYLLNGNNVPVPDWASQDFGISSCSVSHDNFRPGNQHSVSPSGMEGFDLNFNSAKPNGFAGKFKFSTTLSLVRILQFRFTI